MIESDRPCHRRAGSTTPVRESEESRVATNLTAVQHYDAPPAQVYALFGQREFQDGKLVATGGLDPELVTFENDADGLTVVTRQTIPADVLPSMVASMMQGNPTSERTENWHADGDGYLADFTVVIKGAPASLKGTMTLAAEGAGSVLTIAGAASVPIPLFGGKIESVIVEQVGSLLDEEERYTRSALAGS
jgi:hypothetical protein